jgi:hypothetical protein
MNLESIMRRYFLPLVVLSSLALLGVFGFGPQSMTFGKTIGEADATKIWGGDCTPAWAEIVNGACTTYSPSACLWDPDMGCVNQCEIDCANVTTWTAGGTYNGIIVELPPCANFMLPTCDGSDGDCACGSPTTPYPCGVQPWKFFICFKTGP